ncbi:MAG: hypothetical protein WGN25_01920 [Candidatus Electrothrix sp. GW3-4]|uniref:hypothetical protein n=1 Tax=Candidatus Electrothrix sp. GW3-4 TaxID=3126740 RepID=UPI0030CB434C
MRCKWEVTFQISPGVSEPETIGDYHFSLDEKNRTCVTVHFSTESYTEKHPTRQNDSEYAEETICNQHIEKIKDLLLIRMIYQEYFQPINIVIVKKPFLRNREELKQAGERLRRNILAVFRGVHQSIDTGNKIQEALTFYNKRTHLETKDDAVLRISKWLEFCESTSGDVEKFRILWSAFNSLFTVYAHFRRKSGKNEKEKIKISVGGLITTDEARNLLHQADQKSTIDSLISFNIVSDYGDAFSENLKTDAKSPNPDYLLVLKKAVLCVYGIRNEIFHDGPRVDDIEEKATVARDLLAPVIRKCLHKMATTDMG